MAKILTDAIIPELKKKHQAPSGVVLQTFPEATSPINITIEHDGYLTALCAVYGGASTVAAIQDAATDMWLGGISWHVGEDTVQQVALIPVVAGQTLKLNIYGHAAIGLLKVLAPLNK